MLELVAKCGLFLCSAALFAPIIILGFLYRNEKTYGWALFLLLFTAIYNFYLKSLWQTPLPPPNEGWAFPSGHMHSAVVFWGWLACVQRKVWFFVLMFFILCLSGYGLIYHGYHYPEDIWGAVVFGTLTLIIFNFFNTIYFLRDKPYRVGIILSLVGLSLILLLPPETRIPRLWLALGALVGLSGGWRMLQKKLFRHGPALKSFQNNLDISLTYGAGAVTKIRCQPLRFFTREKSEPSYGGSE